MWYQKYLPFIVRKPALQLDWLLAELETSRLTDRELSPYLTLLLDNSNIEDEQLKVLLQEISMLSGHRLIEIADIHRLPRLINSLPYLDVDMAKIAICKEMPSYEKKIQQVLDRIFTAIINHSNDILQLAVTKIIQDDDQPAYIQDNYQRFLAILKDEEFLRSIYKKAL